MAWFSFQDYQGDKHTRGEGHTPLQVKERRSERVCSSFSCFQFQAESILPWQHECHGWVHQDGQSCREIIFLGWHWCCGPANCHSALQYDVCEWLPHGYRHVGFSWRRTFYRLDCIQSGFTSSSPAPFAPQAPSQGQAAWLHARSKQQDSQGRHRCCGYSFGTGQSIARS